MKAIFSVCAAASFLGCVVAGAADFTVQGGSGDIGAKQDSYAAAKAGDTHPLGWWARTAEKQSLVIGFTPENIFRLLPRSEVQVTGEGAANTRFRRVVKLQTGSVELDLPKLEGSKVEVETPTAICGAVGTAFKVDASSGQFDVTKGRIYASAKGESAFRAKSVGGSFTLAPGRENSYSSANVSGDFELNGRSYSGNNVSVTIAKASGGSSDAAVKVNGGSLGGTGGGTYLMQGGKLEPVTGDKVSLHAQYMAAAKKEGGLNVQRATVAATGGSTAALDAQINTAAAQATELRKKLFMRQVIRDAAKEAAKEASRDSARPHF